MNGAIAAYDAKVNQTHADEHSCIHDDVAEWSLQTLERIAYILMTFSKSDRIMKEGLVGADCGLSST